MVAWLAEVKEWSTFATWTWDERFGELGPTPEFAVRMIEKFMQQCDVEAWYCLEHGKIGGRLHAHGLLAQHKGLGLQVHRRSLWYQWFKRFGRNRLEPITESLPVAYYVAKYSLKDFWSDGQIWGFV